MPIHTRDSGSWKQVKSLFVRDGAVWKPVKEGFVRDAGVWKSFYTSELVVVAPTNPNLAGIGILFNNVQAGSYFADIDKRLIVNSSRGPIQIGAAPGGKLTIEITSTGIVSGVGGAGGTAGSPVGGNGGHAFNITGGSNIVFINNGVVRGGGGGGGMGGQGGQGYETQLIREPAVGEMYENPGSSPPYAWFYHSQINQTTVQWNNVQVYNTGHDQNPLSVVGSDGWTYHRGSNQTSYYWAVYRTKDESVLVNGGVGGNGGNGTGSQQSSSIGSIGMPGPGTSGSGGHGGPGGGYGTAGVQGDSGTAGEAGAGNPGSAGGAAGSSIHGYNRVIYSGTGTLIGSTTNS